MSDAINGVLSKHPINIEREKKGLRTGNIVLLRGCGSRLSTTLLKIHPLSFFLEVDSFEKVHGLKGFMIAPTAIISGLGQTLGIDTIKVKDLWTLCTINIIGTWSNW